ncbi:MAG: Na+/H+ antiporter NhaC [Peptoniphilus harei]|uniref:Na+/H+ antiporter NhaC n=1 Tax=Peptoniphilus harei TaxID=54005 RepID=UPI00254D7060|nr:Na+/H+ antiporter NhaC [Peptoniphilus harei]MDK7755843.1 Na+/H+ antiporter NhaC [Peptoniphilus harei]MDK7761365.1 Na+/H+ antiporter NhaC [Peptoniphilus harei]MDK8271186.1 Na+/H+ antiporter NhaC [Peptoniphilus harei]MDK8339676.1 Na+/H+ antiporter NhaC [Peptoniphilus harei]
MSQKNINKYEKEVRKANFAEALFTFVSLTIIMFISIIKYEESPHIPMLIGVLIASLVALKIGYSWKFIENSMIKGISQAMQSIIILAIIGVLIGIWILAGVVPTMIYYGLMILKPSIFLVATVLITSITSLATGTSWGTAGTMGIALMGIASGLGIPAPVTAGAVLSGAYFGDKMSPLSDTTNLAPAMAGTDVFTHIKAMFKPTLLAYGLTLLIFGFLSLKYKGASADLSNVDVIANGLKESFTISPILLLAPLVVIISIAKKLPAVPGISIGIIIAAILGPIYQGVNFGDILSAGLNGYVSNTGLEAVDKLLTTGGLNNMMSSISLTIIAMMFGGIAEETGILEAIVKKFLHRVQSVVGLVISTIFTCFFTNATMPEQYISIVVPGRMFKNEYKDRKIDPRLLSSTLESGGTVTSAMIPWNTCGTYMSTVLGVSTIHYLPFLFFNLLMPLVQVIIVAIDSKKYRID